jgi:hypothetical protein
MISVVRRIATASEGQRGFMRANLDGDGIPEDFAKKRAAIDLEMEQAWSQLGRGAAKNAPKRARER